MIDRYVHAKNILTFWLFIFTWILTVNAQDDIDHQIWTDVVPSKSISDLVVFVGDVGARWSVKNQDWAAIHTRPTIQYDWKPRVRLYSGIWFFYSYNEGSSNTMEIRPWQGIKFNWPQVRDFKFDNFFRLEERFTYYIDSDTTAFSLRFRYRLEIKSPDYTIESIGQTFYFLGSVEIFESIGKEIQEKFINKNRVLLGLGYYISNKWQAEVHFIRQDSRNGSDEEFHTTEYIFRFRLKTNLDYWGNTSPD